MENRPFDPSAYQYPNYSNVPYNMAYSNPSQPNENFQNSSQNTETTNTYPYETLNYLNDEDTTLKETFYKLGGQVFIDLTKRHWNRIFLTLTWENLESKILFSIFLVKFILSFLNLSFFSQIIFSALFIPVNILIVYGLKYLISHNNMKISKKRQLNLTFETFERELKFFYSLVSHLFRLTIVTYNRSLLAFYSILYIALLNFVIFCLCVPFEKVFWGTATFTFLIPLIYFHKFDITIMKTVLISLDSLLGGELAENLKEKSRTLKKKIFTLNRKHSSKMSGQQNIDKNVNPLNFKQE